MAAIPPIRCKRLNQAGLRPSIDEVVGDRWLRWVHSSKRCDVAAGFMSFVRGRQNSACVFMIYTAICVQGASA
jgi:hypothetical protein